jgi:ATP-dependent exoDNAse (exonuclease V) alpha subunit
VLVLAPTGKAVDEAMQEGAGDRGLTVAKALMLIQDNALDVDSSTVVIVDEASMLGTPELKKLLSAAVLGRAKMVLVGDLSALPGQGPRRDVRAALCRPAVEPTPRRGVADGRSHRTRHLPGAASRARQSAAQRGEVVSQSRPSARRGSDLAMASDALDAYLKDRAAHKDALLIADTWEMADALNRRLHDTLTADGPAVKAARDQQIRVGDIIMSRSNDVTIDVRPGRAGERADQVRNGNRWRVAAIDPDTNRLAAERLTDKARAIFEADYLKEHITLGYAATVHSAQGVTADSSYAILGEGASRAMACVAMTRGRRNNEAFLYHKFSNEADHEHAKPISSPALHQMRRGNKYSAEHHFKRILHNDDRPRTMHAEAERTEPTLLPEVIAEVIQRHEARRRARRAAWQAHVKTAQAWRAGHERMAAAAATPTAGIDLDAGGLEL